MQKKNCCRKQKRYCAISTALKIISGEANYSRTYERLCLLIERFIYAATLFKKLLNIRSAMFML